MYPGLWPRVSRAVSVFRDLGTGRTLVCCDLVGVIRAFASRSHFSPLRKVRVNALISEWGYNHGSGWVVGYP